MAFVRPELAAAAAAAETAVFYLWECRESHLSEYSRCGRRGGSLSLKRGGGKKRGGAVVHFIKELLPINSTVVVCLLSWCV